MNRLTALLLAACAGGCISYGGSDGDGCEGQTCSGHGTCRLEDGAARCDCEPGWELDPDDPLACLEREDVIVDIVTGIDPPSGDTIAVRLRDHRDVKLDRDDIQIIFLETSLTYGTPVYLEIDPDSRLIKLVLVPYDSPVAALREQAEWVEVELIYSAAIHVLRRDQPGFDVMLAELEASLADGTHRLVTETRDSHEIIDVRPPLNP
ncbi:MAG: hypothetical protein JXR96_19865 [Deltaproteobacteria bacterium]|nr:hypothetical protein [Deltaproteobacteria bacterium]